jgi:hypothetical protein
MSSRFLVFIIFLAISARLVAFGLHGNDTRVFKKPDPRDDQVNLPMETSFLLSEIQLTDWVSKQRVKPDGFGHLIDLEQEAECFS